MTIKRYFRLFVLALIIGLSAWAIMATNRAATFKNEASRLEQNLIASTFEVQQLKTKLGESMVQVDGLTVTAAEFKHINKKLTADLDNMKIKLKNAQGVVHIQMQYDVQIDTIFLDTLSKPKAFYYKDNWVGIKGYYNENDRFKIDSLDLIVKDDMTIVPIVEGKWWQCRKKWRVAVRIQSKNPYNYIDKVEYYKFIKK